VRPAVISLLPRAHDDNNRSADDGGWRVPFILSIVMLGISVYIRLQMNESPAFQKMKSEGKTSKASLAESFGQWKNLKIVLLALAVVTYFPLFNALTKAANPDLAKAQQTAKVSVTAAAGDCSFQGNPVAREIDFTKSATSPSASWPRTR
jgi:hypothetical protein